MEQAEVEIAEILARSTGDEPVFELSLPEEAGMRKMDPREPTLRAVLRPTVEDQSLPLVLVPLGGFSNGKEGPSLMTLVAALTGPTAEIQKKYKSDTPKILLGETLEKLQQYPPKKME